MSSTREQISGVMYGTELQILNREGFDEWLRVRAALNRETDEMIRRAAVEKMLGNQVGFTLWKKGRKYVLTMRVKHIKQLTAGG